MLLRYCGEGRSQIAGMVEAAQAIFPPTPTADQPGRAGFAPPASDQRLRS
jgi:hypothetical protein